MHIGRGEATNPRPKGIQLKHSPQVYVTVILDRVNVRRMLGYKNAILFNKAWSKLKSTAKNIGNIRDKGK